MWDLFCVWKSKTLSVLNWHITDIVQDFLGTKHEKISHFKCIRHPCNKVSKKRMSHCNPQMSLKIASLEGKPDSPVALVVVNMYEYLWQENEVHHCQSHWYRSLCAHFKFKNEPLQLTTALVLFNCSSLTCIWSLITRSTMCQKTINVDKINIYSL